MSSKGRRTATNYDDLVERVACLVEFDKHVKGGGLPPDIKRDVLIKFWAGMREVLFANSASVGMEQLDAVAYALITDEAGEAAEAFNGIVTLVPPTSRQQADCAKPEHHAFTTPKPNQSKAKLRSFSPAKRSRKS